MYTKCIYEIFVLCGLIAGYIYYNRTHSLFSLFLGFLVGLIFGPIGIAFALLTPTKIDKMKAKGDVKGLIKALGDRNANIQRDASNALVWLGKHALEPLIAALKNESRLIRVGAVMVLGRINNAGAVNPLIAELKGDIGEYSVRALINIGAQAIEPLIAALKDPDRDIRYASVTILKKIMDIRAVDPLITALLEDKDKDIRCNAIGALSSMGDVRAVVPLITTLLEDKDKDIRCEAIKALASIGDRKAVVPIMTALRDKDEFVRIHAVRAMAEFNDELSVPRLIVALKDEDEIVRDEAMRALERMARTGNFSAQNALAGFEGGKMANCKICNKEIRISDGHVVSDSDLESILRVHFKKISKPVGLGDDFVEMIMAIQQMSGSNLICNECYKNFMNK
jgi:HEAT repeat protein